MKYWKFIGRLHYPKKKQVMILNYYFGFICFKKNCHQFVGASSFILREPGQASESAAFSEVCGSVAVSRALGKKRRAWKPRNPKETQVTYIRIYI